MYGDSGVGFFVRKHGLVHSLTIHAGTPIFRKQGGVDVNHSIRKRSDKFGADFLEESSQNNDVNPGFIQHGEYSLFVPWVTLLVK
jgi:hypothetical protein